MAFFLTDFWLVGPLAFPSLALLAVGLVSYVEEFVFRRSIVSGRLKGAVVATSMLSAALSLVALIVGVLCLSQFPADSHWYVNAASRVLPRSSLSLVALNFPFDFLTIAVTAAFLNLVRKHKYGLLLFALGDAAVSAILTVCLRAVLLGFESGWDGGIPGIAIASYTWFLDAGSAILTALVEGTSMRLMAVHDVHLLPLLLTTFVPVLLYLIPFLALGLTKGILVVVARVFRVAGSKKKPVFSQFAVLISAVVALIKFLIG